MRHWWFRIDVLECFRLQIDRQFHTSGVIHTLVVLLHKLTVVKLLECFFTRIIWVWGEKLIGDNLGFDECCEIILTLLLIVEIGVSDVWDVSERLADVLAADVVASSFALACCNIYIAVSTVALVADFFTCYLKFARIACIYANLWAVEVIVSACCYTAAGIL